MNNILTICQTPYQIIVASKIIESFYKDSKVDIIITNTISDGIGLVEQLKKTNLFRNIFFIETKKINLNKTLNPIINFINKENEIKTKIKPYIKKYKYNKVMFANIDVIVQKTASLLRGYTEFELIMFEDGLSSYRKEFGDFFKRYAENKNIIDRVRFNFLRSEFSKINLFYIFNPKYLEWNPKFEIKKIPYIQRSDEKLIKELNKIFSYDSLVHEYNTEYIFFEESYYADGYEVNDIEIVNKIAEVLGKDSLMVKIHPRNPINRFKEMGYKTNKTTSIPWEIIALNIRIEDKTLITIASGAVLNPFIIMGMDLNAIMLYKLKELDAKLIEDLIDIIDNICSKNLEIYLIPQDYGDLEKMLEISIKKNI